MGGGVEPPSFRHSRHQALLTKDLSGDENPNRVVTGDHLRLKEKIMNRRKAKLTPSLSRWIAQRVADQSYEWSRELFEEFCSRERLTRPRDPRCASALWYRNTGCSRRPKLPWHTCRGGGGVLDHVDFFERADGSRVMTAQPYPCNVGKLETLTLDDPAKIRGLERFGAWVSVKAYPAEQSFYYPGSTLLLVIEPSVFPPTAATWRAALARRRREFSA